MNKPKNKTKMTCCSVKTLSYLSASLRLVLCSLGFFFFVIYLVLKDYIQEPEVYRNVIWITFLFLFYTTLLVMVLVGLKKNRVLLLSIYLYVDHGLLVIGIIFMVYEIVSGFVLKENSCEILLHLLIEGGCVGLELLLTTPIHIWHKRVLQKSSEEGATSVKEPYSDVSDDLEESMQAGIYN